MRALGRVLLHLAVVVGFVLTVVGWPLLALAMWAGLWVLLRLERPA